MTCKKNNIPDLKDAKLVNCQPVVCVELIDYDKLKETVLPLGPLKWSSMELGDKKLLANILSPPRLHQVSFQLMGRHARTIVPDDNTPVVAVEKKPAKKAAEVASKTGKSLRSSNVMNIPPPIFQRNDKEMTTPSPPSTPVTRSRSLNRTSNVTGPAGGEKGGTTRRLLPVAAQPKTCPRILRQTPQRKGGIAVYRDDDESSSSSASRESSSEESSDSSVMCSPRKKSAVATPSAKSKAKKNEENVEPPGISTRSGRTPSTRKSTSDDVDIPAPESVSRRGRPSTKTPKTEVVPAPPVRRRGRPLLKTGTVAKAVKQTANSSPTSMHEGSETDSESDESILTRALKRLHVSKEEFSRQVAASSRTSNWAPLGREQEAREIFTFVSDHLKSGTSGSLFVAGVPGIGKSATIGAVLERLTTLSQSKTNDTPRFRLVTVNGFHFATPVRFYCEVHRQLTKASTVPHRGTSGQQKVKRSLGPKAALDTLNGYFTGKSTLGSLLPTVLVVDELDALVSATSGNQIAFGATGGQNTTRRTTSFGANRVLYNLLEWASTPVSRLVIVAVANTLDLPERALPLRVVSRLGLHRLAFMPYTHLQLDSIVRARLASLPVQVFDSPDAILLAARKVAMASGDARRVLELCRLAVERAIRQSRQMATMQDVVAASESLSSATSRLGLVRQVAISWRRVLTALVNVCRMQCRDHGACLVRELHAELVEMWREEGGFSRPSDVEVIRIVGQLVACGLIAAEDVSHLGIQAHVQLTMPLTDLATILASLLGTGAPNK